MPKKEVIRVKLPSNPKYISVLRATVSEVTQKMGFTKEKSQELKLVVNEACANVIEHAYGGKRDKAIFIYFNLFPDRLEIIIRDFGRKVKAAQIKSRPLDEVQEHGLGVFIMQNLVDELEYDTSPSIGTELRLVKKI